MDAVLNTSWIPTGQGSSSMNKFEILAWGLLISFFTAAISGVVVLWWFARNEHAEKGASHE